MNPTVLVLAAERYDLRLPIPGSTSKRIVVSTNSYKCDSILYLFITRSSSFICTIFFMTTCRIFRWVEALIAPGFLKSMTN